MIIILDKDKLVVLENESSPVLNDCRLGRFENMIISYLTILLDKDKLVVKENDPFRVLNDCRLGRYTHQTYISRLLSIITFFTFSKVPPLQSPSSISIVFNFSQLQIFNEFKFLNEFFFTIIDCRFG